MTNSTTATGNTPFDKTAVTNLINMMWGEAGNPQTQVASLETSTATTPLTATDLRNKSYLKTSGKSIVVSLGGLDWIVTYVSNDTDGNLIATLWLSNNHQTAWGWDGVTGGSTVTSTIELDTKYKLLNGGLYSQWAGYAEDEPDGVATYPCNMYGSSYVRTETLNNPHHRQYGTAEHTLSQESLQSEDHIFALYTMPQFGLINLTDSTKSFITTPNKMPWIINFQDPTLRGYSTSNDLSNESLAINGNYPSSLNDYSAKEWYTYWGTDYLWLPSMLEMGNSGDSAGLWETNAAERSSYDGTTDYLSSNGYSYHSDLYSRTEVNYTFASQVSTIEVGGSYYNNFWVSSSNAIRPAMLLNLSNVVKTLSSKISFNKQNGSGGSDSVDVGKGEAFPNIIVPTRTGYTFGGYYTQENGAGTKIYNADGTPAVTTSTFEADTTIYASWTSNTYSVRYNANGGSGSMSNSTHTYNVAKNLTANAFTRTGYTFAGWATSSTGAKVYNNSQSVSNLTSTNGATVNLYAVWSLNNYTITVTASDSSATGVLQGAGAFAYGSTTTISAYAKKDYNFSHWLRDGQEFDGNDLNSITITIDASNHTYTAVFEEAGVKAETFLVSATKGGMAYLVGEDASELDDNDTFTVATKPCLLNYEFVGWYLDNDRTTCLSTATSYRVAKSVAYKHILVAVYQPTSGSGVNLDVDNG